MPAADFIPRADPDFIAWSTNFFTVLNGNLAAVGLGESDVEPLQDVSAGLAAAYTDQIAKVAAANAAVELKKTRRAAYEPTLRALVRRIQAHPGMTDSLRAQLKITVPTRTRTRRGVGAEVPGLVLDLKAGQVVVHFGTNPGDEQTNGKPAWAAGCNVYRKKAGETAFALLAFDTASPYVDSVTGAAANYAYKAAYRGVREGDEGAHSPEQTVAAGS